MVSKTKLQKQIVKLKIRTDKLEKLVHHLESIVAALDAKDLFEEIKKW